MRSRSWAPTCAAARAYPAGPRAVRKSKWTRPLRLRLEQRTRMRYKRFGHASLYATGPRYIAICASPAAKLHIATKQAELVILFSSR